MAKKKKQPFHIVHNFNKYKLSDGTVFWAKDDEASKDYIKFVEGRNAKK
jgi:hypothetical protein|tara:strand:+ start:127 stop:273 length:147 start_codon:yes stop_codon:yes gene_type:complete